jgi:hypothetical protein
MQREEGERLSTLFPREWELLVFCQGEIDRHVFELYRIPKYKHADIFQLARARAF